MSGGQAGIVYGPREGGPISEGRTQKLPLTRRPGLFAVTVGLSTAGDLFGVVSQITYRQALARHAGPLGPLTVELFAVGRLTRTPRIVVPGFACRHAKTPCAGARLTNSAPMSQARRPWADLYRVAYGDRYAPTLQHDGLDENTRPSLSASPSLREPDGTSLDRTRGLLCSMKRRLRYKGSRSTAKKDYSREPPSSTDKPVSRHPALPAQRTTGG